MSIPKYLNTDLEVDSRRELTPLVEEFGDAVFLMYNGEWGKNYRCSFEVNEHLAHANEAIAFFCMLVETLPKNVRKIWDESLKKAFSIGFESGEVEKIEVEIEPPVLERVAKIGAKINIVIYPEYEKDT